VDGGIQNRLCVWSLNHLIYKANYIHRISVVILSDMSYMSARCTFVDRARCNTHFISWWSLCL